LAYNLQSAIKGVMRSEYGVEKVEQDLSRYFMSDEIGQVYRGMMVAVPAEEWAIFGEMAQPFHGSFSGFACSPVISCAVSPGPPPTNILTLG
jgi:hypothetical protein